MILKIQRPLATNDATPKALIYNQDRTVFTFAPFTKYIQDLFDKHDKDGALKLYVEADMINDGIDIKKILGTQDW